MRLYERENNNSERIGCIHGLVSEQSIERHPKQHLQQCDLENRKERFVLFQSTAFMISKCESIAEKSKSFEVICFVFHSFTVYDITYD